MDKKLLQRYVEGDVTTEEVETVVDWLDADEKHVKEYMSLQKLHDISVMNQPEGNKDSLRKHRGITIRRISNELLRIAAIILVLLGINYLMSQKETLESPVLYQTLYVPAGQRAELFLPDSTRVWLNADSKLVYPITFQKENRQVELDGEAYFEVRHDAASPFVVKTKRMDVKVLGTEFNVVAYSELEDFRISLLKGSVELESTDTNRTYRMEPGEQILFQEGKYLSSRIGNMDYFKWKEGLLCFNDQPIYVIIEKLRLYYDIRIEVANLPFLKERYSGKFRVKDGVEQVLKVLQLEHKFTYAKDNELNLITIK